MITVRTLTAAGAALVLSAGVASAAEAPVISKQHIIVSGKSPVSVPGTGLKKGEKIPAGARLVWRKVTLNGEQKPTLTLRAPDGKTLRGLAEVDGDNLGFAVVSRGSYVGKQQVKVRAFAAPKSDGEVSGRIYALVR